MSTKRVPTSPLCAHCGLPLRSGSIKVSAHDIPGAPVVGWHLKASGGCFLADEHRARSAVNAVRRDVLEPIVRAIYAATPDRVWATPRWATYYQRTQQAAT